MVSAESISVAAILILRGTPTLKRKILKSDHFTGCMLRSNIGVKKRIIRTGCSKTFVQ